VKDAACEQFVSGLRAQLSENTQRSGLQPQPRLREAAVTALLSWRDAEPWVILTKRPQSMRQHAGQLSFPGGAREEGDLTPLHTALRETHEEIGLHPDDVTVLGRLSPLATISSFWVTPFVGLVSSAPVLTPNPDEIARVLVVPLLRLKAETRHIWGAERGVLVAPNESEPVWGATFQMLHELWRLSLEVSF
jgi:8-oxo-dGTP pyrophosphatase MutT (NUDIX family)